MHERCVFPRPTRSYNYCGPLSSAERSLVPNIMKHSTSLASIPAERQNLVGTFAYARARASIKPCAHFSPSKSNLPSLPGLHSRNLTVTRSTPGRLYKLMHLPHSKHTRMQTRQSAIVCRLFFYARLHGINTLSISSSPLLYYMINS